MDKRWIVLVIALVIIILVLIYYNTPPQQPTKTTKKTQSPSLTLIANVYVNTTTINTTFFLQ